MKWFWLGLIIVTALIEGLMLSNMKIFNAEMSILWALVLVLILKRLISFRYALLLTAVGGYLLDLTSAFRSGIVVMALVISVLVAAYILSIEFKKLWIISKEQLAAISSALGFSLVQLAGEWPLLSATILLKFAGYLILLIILYSILALIAGKPVRP